MRFRFRPYSRKIRDQLGEVKCSVVRHARAPNCLLTMSRATFPIGNVTGSLPTALRPKFPNGNIEERVARGARSGVSSRGLAHVPTPDDDARVGFVDNVGPCLPRGPGLTDRLPSASGRHRPLGEGTPASSPTIEVEQTVGLPGTVACRFRQTRQDARGLHLRDRVRHRRFCSPRRRDGDRHRDDRMGGKDRDQAPGGCVCARIPVLTQPITPLRPGARPRRSCSEPPAWRPRRWRQRTARSNPRGDPRGTASGPPDSDPCPARARR